MTTDQPMTISRICDRLWFNVTGAMKDAATFHEDGTITHGDSPDADWYIAGLMQAHKIETEEKNGTTRNGN